MAVLSHRLPGDGQPLRGPEQTEPTSRHLREKGWWPTKRDAARGDYAGSGACLTCHREQADQPQTPMAHAAWKAFDTDALRSQQLITNSTSPFETQIVRERKGSTYTAGRGGEAISGQIVWSMGDDQMGQTFVVQSGPDLYESQLSYFQAIRGLDLTPGHQRGSSQDLQNAFGTPLSTETTQQCFGCHTTGSSVHGRFDEAHATPGVTCEACHGPGALHVKAEQEKDGERGQREEAEGSLLNPRELSPVRVLDYCGACHRAPLDVIAEKDFLPINVRFQPYRLAKSRCWSRPDARITCTACHNPHKDLVREAAFYDGRCLACHGPTEAKPGQARQAVERPKACPVAARNCVSCHMPRYQVPQMHGSFTDHDIRVVRPGDPYPL